MELDDAQLVVLKAPKTKRLCRLPEITTQLLEIIHRPAQLHLGTIFTPHAGRGIRLLMDERSELATVHAVSTNGVLLGWTVMLVSLFSLISHPLVNEQIHVSFCVIAEKENSSCV